MKHTLRLALLGTFLFGCGGGAATEPAQGEAATAGAEQPLVAPGEARIGDRTTCPVSGEEFVVSESSPSVEHEGRTYYFCCPGCLQRFQADPSGFLEGGAASTEADEPS